MKVGDAEGRRLGGEYVTLQEAAELLGVHRGRMRLLARRHKLPVYALPTDQRVKLFRRSDLERLMQPQQLEDEGKAVAA